jgi:tetratricopeptide (TPR) repeat protein
VQIQLGQREEAMKLVQRSLAEYQKMEQDFPDAPWRERALLGTISAQTNLATLLMRDARKLDEALRLHQEAIAAFDRVPKEDRQVPPFANKEAQTRNNFGALLLRAGKPTEARRELDAAMEIRARVVATHSTPSFRREYGESLHNLSELLERSEPERAVGLLERAVAIFTRLKDELPTRPEFRSHFARSSGKLAQILARLNRPLEAEPHFVAYLETARALAREFPRQLQYRRELGFALTGYGIFLAADQNYAESKRHLREAMQLALALGNERSTDLETHQLLGYVLFASDRPFRRSQALQELCEFRQQALALRVKAKDPRIERILPGPSLAQWHELGIQDWISLGRYEEAFALFAQLLTIRAKDARALAGRLALLSSIVKLAREDDGVVKATLLERIDRYERRGVELLRALHSQAPELLDHVDWSFLHERPKSAPWVSTPRPASVPRRRSPEPRHGEKASERSASPTRPEHRDASPLERRRPRCARAAGSRSAPVDPGSSARAPRRGATPAGRERRLRAGSPDRLPRVWPPLRARERGAAARAAGPHRGEQHPRRAPSPSP